ncbi:hypothetical protein [Flavobacterium sp. ACN6]|uniref:hypothetical protein n=1 Tax=Flavobacterium sp. ACN6 TaxID=1920426 RepID=UPI000BB2FA12|nr:hypothetical protein [Flavobacterium sp. ACN6]PBJ06653.1 hypothetical protein BSF42_41100 [Flavobacterium sp. ACN6]
MIGILLIYWIWKAYTNLAIEYDKNKWTYFFIGVIAYYGSTAIAGFVVGLFSVFINGIDSTEGESYINPGWNIFFVLCGALGCYGVFKLLENKVQKERAMAKKEGIESIGVSDEN